MGPRDIKEDSDEMMGFKVEPAVCKLYNSDGFRSFMKMILELHRDEAQQQNDWFVRIKYSLLAWA